MNSRTKADFRARREMAGLSQADVADAVHVDIRSVKRWENPSYDTMPPDDAWMLVDHMLIQQRKAVEIAVQKAEEMVASLPPCTEPPAIEITYYRNQSDYDAMGRDPGPVGVADANSRAVAAALEAQGHEVLFRYPQECAIRTPGSRY